MGGGAVRWEVGRALRTFGSGSSVLLFFATRKARERRFGPVAGPGAHAEGWEPAARRRGRTQSGSEAIGLDSMRALAAAKRWFLSQRERSAVAAMIPGDGRAVATRRGEAGGERCFRTPLTCSERGGGSEQGGGAEDGSGDLGPRGLEGDGGARRLARGLEGGGAGDEERGELHFMLLGLKRWARSSVPFDGNLKEIKCAPIQIANSSCLSQHLATSPLLFGSAHDS